MTDIVERLRKPCISNFQQYEERREAADEIERLKAINRRAKQLADEHAKEVVRLRAALRKIIETDSLPNDPGPCGHIAKAALTLEQSALTGECQDCGLPLAMGVHSDNCPHS